MSESDSRNPLRYKVRQYNKNKKKKKAKKTKVSKEVEKTKYGDELVEVKEEVARGFDRGADFIEIKEKLLKDFNDRITKIRNAPEHMTKAETRVLVNQTNYEVIALIQLRNGARISEGCISYR